MMKQTNVFPLASKQQKLDGWWLDPIVLEVLCEELDFLRLEPDDLEFVIKCFVRHGFMPNPGKDYEEDSNTNNFSNVFMHPTNKRAPTT